VDRAELFHYRFGRSNRRSDPFSTLGQAIARSQITTAITRIVNNVSLTLRAHAVVPIEAGQENWLEFIADATRIAT